MIPLVFACSSESADPVSPESGGGSGGGSSGSGGYGAQGGTSSGGANAGGGSGGTSATGGASGSAGQASVECSELPICDDFESATAGGPPPAPFSVVSPDCSGTGTLAIDDAQAHSGTKSVKVSGAGGFCNHVFLSTTAGLPLSSAKLYARFWIRLGNALGSSHVSFLALRIPGDGNKHLRMGGQNSVLMWNRESDDATLPAMSPAGVATSLPLPVDTWTCIELAVDGTNGDIDTWVDGTEIDGLSVDGTPTPDIDQQWLAKAGYLPIPDDFALGWESYGGDANTLFIDDVAIASERIGCAR